MNDTAKESCTRRNNIFQKANIPMRKKNLRLYYLAFTNIYIYMKESHFLLLYN